MRLRFWRAGLAAGLLGLTLAACNYAAPGQAQSGQIPEPAPPTATEWIPPTAPVVDTPSPAAPVTATAQATDTVQVTDQPIQPTATPAPTACPPDTCTYAEALFMQRPIQPPGQDSFDTSYRFGTTQSGLRDPHHGVEFLNPFGTPVLAAGDGVVVVAGPDMDPTSPHGVWPITYHGPYSNFYGNLIVIEHTLPAGLAGSLPAEAQPVYSLYGHLSQIDVQVGQTVQTGQEIGKVGQAGIATGSHLHFEVRVGENSYKASSNPELWLASKPGDPAASTGAIAGSFIDSFGNLLEMPSVVLEHLPEGAESGANAPVDFRVTVITYEEKGLLGRPPYYESFSVGDLPTGWYRLSFPMGGLREELVQVLPGAVTAVVYRSR